MFGFGAPQNPQGMPGRGLGGFLNNNANMLTNVGLALLDHRRNSNATSLTDVAKMATIGSALDTEKKDKAEAKQSQNMTAQWLMQNGYAQDLPEAMMLVQTGAVKDIFANKYAAPKTTTGYQDYLHAQSDPGYAQHMRDMKTLGGVNVETNINGEKEYDKTVGKGYGEQFLTTQQDAVTARKTLNSLDVMEQTLSDPGFYSGAGSGAVLQAKRFASALGMDPEGVDSIETFNAMAKQAALDNMGGSLGTGFSNADRDFVTDQVPGLQNTPEGNRKLIDITRRINERKIEMAELARRYAAQNGGRIDDGLYEVMERYAEENPIFPEAEQQQRSAPAGVDPQIWEYMTPEERALWQN